VVPNIRELKALTYLNLSSTGIAGAFDFNHHPMMILISTLRLQRFRTSKN
jgi:hypothetical protein